MFLPGYKKGNARISAAQPTQQSMQMIFKVQHLKQNFELYLCSWNSSSSSSNSNAYQVFGSECLFRCSVQIHNQLSKVLLFTCHTLYTHSMSTLPCLRPQCQDNLNTRHDGTDCTELRSIRQDPKFQVKLGFLVRICLKNKINKIQNTNYKPNQCFIFLPTIIDQS